MARVQTQKKELKEPKLAFFPTAQIRPTGYILRQLRIQADGLSGNLHRFWRDVKDSKWIGGDADGWERVPYWLDGFIPLAWLLDDEEMKRTAKRYIDAIIAHRSEDGWICPCEPHERGKYDVWAYMLILKVLTVYHDATGDGRIYDVVYRALKKLNRHIDSFTLFDWAQMRWFECLIPAYWLLRRCKEEWLYAFIRKLHSQGFDYASFFRDWSCKDKTPRGEWSQVSHVVNNAMMLKGDALYRLFDPAVKDSAESMYRKLMKYHGTVVGTFTGDECLAGKDPVQGTELCAVAELMFSFEQLLSATGNPVWADRLDTVTFNALFATFSPDMWTHQYDQQVNQIACTEMKDPVYTTNPGDSNLFGLEPNFGCCTANLSQALPKFVLTSFLRSRKGIAVVNLSPAELNTELGGKRVTVRVESEYPFGDEATVTVNTETPFELSVRIPAGAGATGRLNGHEVPLTAGFNAFAVDGDVTLKISLSPEIEAIKRGDRVAFKRGALVYALKIGEEWRRIHEDVAGREYPHCDYEVLPTTPWNYAVTDTAARFEGGRIDGCPFDPEKVPVRLIVQGAEYPWKVADGCAYPEKYGRVGGSAELVFIPYGATNLRLTELPLRQKKHHA